MQIVAYYKSLFYIFVIELENKEIVLAILFNIENK